MLVCGRFPGDIFRYNNVSQNSHTRILENLKEFKDRIIPFENFDLKKKVHIWYFHIKTLGVFTKNII